MTKHPQVSYDDQQVCPCGRHLVRATWTRPYCPFAPPRVPGRWGVLWAQPEDMPLGE